VATWTAPLVGYPAQAETLGLALLSCHPKGKFLTARRYLGKTPTGLWVTSDNRFLFRNYGGRWKMKPAYGGDALTDDMWWTMQKHLSRNPRRSRGSLTQCLDELGYAAHLLTTGAA